MFESQVVSAIWIFSGLFLIAIGLFVYALCTVASKPIPVPVPDDDE